MTRAGTRRFTDGRRWYFQNFCNSTIVILHPVFLSRISCPDLPPTVNKFFCRQYCEILLYYPVVIVKKLPYSGILPYSWYSYYVLVVLKINFVGASGKPHLPFASYSWFYKYLGTRFSLQYRIGPPNFCL